MDSALDRPMVEPTCFWLCDSRNGTGDFFECPKPGQTAGSVRELVSISVYSWFPCLLVEQCFDIHFEFGLKDAGDVPGIGHDLHRPIRAHSLQRLDIQTFARVTFANDHRNRNMHGADLALAHRQSAEAMRAGRGRSRRSAVWEAAP